MMNIKVPETCCAYYNCNKPFSGIELVFLLYAYATMREQTHGKVQMCLDIAKTVLLMCLRYKKRCLWWKVKARQGLAAYLVLSKPAHHDS